MRAEAVGDGQLAELMVGNVAVNRVRVDCFTFKNARTIQQAIFQPHAFTATQHGFFYQKARKRETRLARQVVRGGKYYPATYSLWYYRPYGPCPAKWYGQPNVGKYKSFCYFSPTDQDCPGVYQY